MQYTTVCLLMKLKTSARKMSIMSRYVKGNVYEHFVGFVHATNLDTEALVQYSCAMLTTCNLSLDLVSLNLSDDSNVMS